MLRGGTGNADTEPQRSGAANVDQAEAYSFEPEGCCGSNKTSVLETQALTADRRSLIPGVTFRSLAARITHPGLQTAATPLANSPRGNLLYRGKVSC